MDFFLLPVYLNRNKIMEKTDYIQLFDKFLRKETSTEEVQVLIQWLKSESSFQDWADEEWDATSFNMDTELQQKLLGQIKKNIIGEEKTQSSIEKNKYSKLYLWTARIASVVILLLLTGFSVYHYAKEQLKMPDMVLSVEKGQKANITLPDGSKVWVNSDSKLVYGSRFTAKERILELEGEAYFEVAPDKNRPFIVETRDLSVKALGTCFDVKSYKEDNWVSTVLMTGKVEVWSENEKLFLEPNQRVLFNKSTGKMAKSKVADAAGFSSWMYNVLNFEEETFENIVWTLQRLYNTRIVFESESLKKYRFTGSPGNTSLESILQILSLTSPLSYEVKDSMIILRENKKEKAWYEKALK